MKRRLIFCGLAVMLIFGLTAASCVPGARPEVLNLGTMPAGMAVNAQGVGIADIVNKYTDLELKVVPMTSEEAWVPLTATGEIHLGVAVSLPLYQAYAASGVFKGLAEKAGVENFPLRVITGGSPMPMNLLVRGDDPAQTVADLKGRRVVCFEEGTPFDLYTKAHLANGGLTIDDITCVPAANPIESARHVMEGRADAGDLAAGAPIATEAVATVNARWLSMDPSPEVVERMREFCPPLYVALFPGGVWPGVPEDQYLQAVDTLFVAHEDVNEAAVYEITKALWEHNSELLGKPVLNQWTQDRFLETVSGVPYHPGAIKFYKEIGIWTEEMEEYQEAILAAKP